VERRFPGRARRGEVADPRQSPLAAFLRSQRTGSEDPFVPPCLVCFAQATLTSFVPSGHCAPQRSGAVSNVAPPMSLGRAVSPRVPRLRRVDPSAKRTQPELFRLRLTLLTFPLWGAPFHRRRIGFPTPPLTRFAQPGDRNPESGAPQSLIAR
jgi:hypothetical protein